LRDVPRLLKNPLWCISPASVVARHALPLLGPSRHQAAASPLPLSQRRRRPAPTLGVRERRPWAGETPALPGAGLLYGRRADTRAAPIWDRQCHRWAGGTPVLPVLGPGLCGYEMPPL